MLIAKESASLVHASQGDWQSMILYCDTSFLFSLYHYNAHSAAARKHAAKHFGFLSLSPFNRFELCNAFRFSEYCSVLSPGKSELYMPSFEKNVRTGCFAECFCHLATILTEAHHISSRYTLEKRCRAFDIIHTATALHRRAKVF